MKTEQMPFKKGDKVTYIYNGKSEKGRVKKVKNEDYTFVVFKCGGDWSRYNDYTAALTYNGYLKRDWEDE
jgi:hypothetical protein